MLKQKIKVIDFLISKILDIPDDPVTIINDNFDLEEFEVKYNLTSIMNMNTSFFIGFGGWSRQNHRYKFKTQYLS